MIDLEAALTDLADHLDHPPGDHIADAVLATIAADTSAGGFILPNDFVDVIMTRRADPAAGGSGFSTETILQNSRVLAIDQTIQEDEEGKKTRVGQTATLRTADWVEADYELVAIRGIGPWIPAEAPAALAQAALRRIGV